jgi:hypothetical protein
MREKASALIYSLSFMVLADSYLWESASLYPSKHEVNYALRLVLITLSSYYYYDYLSY